MLALAVGSLLFSGIMAAIGKRHLMFIERMAPKYVFDLFQTGVFIIYVLVVNLIFSLD